MEFLSRQGRQRHEAKIHRGVVLYSCGVCQKGFHLLELFTKHPKRVPP